MKLVRIAVVALAALAAVPSWAADGPKWSDWGDDLFTRAAAEKRFVILDLEAVWCHWCHVMEKTTYANPQVQELLAAKYLPVRVDQDANPDLSSRYGDWGWPATIVFGPDGTEIAKIRGYIEPERMQALLKAIIDDPSPGPSVGEAFEVKPSASAFLDKQARAELTKNIDESYDDKLGGWGENQKFIDADSMDLAITRAEAGDAMAIKRARQTLDAAIALIDPVWGGVYQYSEAGSWTHPHFEKIMSFQAQYLRQYSQAYALWKDPKYLAAARNIERYLASFLTSPDGAFYVSQDADLDHDTDGHKYYALSDGERRKLGMPRIDKNLYARENGWAISGLAAYYDVTNDAKALAIAERAAKWVIANRALPDGGFRHGEKDRGGPFLGDTLAMGQAFLDLYAATGNRDWLTSAAKAGDFVATLPRRGRRFCHFENIGRQNRRVGKARKTDRRPGAGRPVHEPAQPLLRRRELSRPGRACDALSRQRLGRDDAPFARRAARRRRTRGRADPYDDRRRQRRAARAIPACPRPRAAGPLQAAGMARPARRQAAQPRRRISRSRRTRGLCLQQPDLLVSVVQCRGAAGDGEADGEAEAFAGVAELGWRLASRTHLHR